jgi:hypothetical protein
MKFNPISKEDTIRFLCGARIAFFSILCLRISDLELLSDHTVELSNRLLREPSAGKMEDVSYYICHRRLWDYI